MDTKVERPQIAAALTLIGVAVARALWPAFASKVDVTFFTLVAIGLIVLVVPLKAIKSLKAGGFELSLEAPHVQGAVASLSLGLIEDAQLRSRLHLLAHLLPVVTGSRLLWIDDRPDKIIGERRLLRALGVTVIPATSSDEARELLRADKDFDLIVSDVQRSGETHKITGGEPIHEGVHFVVWLRTQKTDSYVKEIPVLFYAAYEWPRLIKFTKAARETFPEPGVSNSVADFVPKALLALAERREIKIKVPSEKTPTDIQNGS